MTLLRFMELPSTQFRSKSVASRLRLCRHLRNRPRPAPLALRRTPAMQTSPGVRPNHFCPGAALAQPPLDLHSQQFDNSISPVFYNIVLPAGCISGFRV
jgi:hypothetical protein